MATAPATATGGRSTTMARTYREMYLQTTDVLGGDYRHLYDRVNAVAPGEAYKLALTASDIIPKVYLCMTMVAGKPTISAVHRPSSYESHPVETSQWDGKHYCFTGDLLTGNHISMYEFPESVFEETDNQLVPTMAAMDGLLAALPPNETLIPAPAPGAPDTELVSSKHIIQVPHSYIGLVLTKRFRPKDAWNELAGAIRNDGKEATLAPLLTWLRMACTAASTDAP